MKVKVLKAFRDKNTKEIASKGEIITISAKRSEEINAAAGGPYVEIIKERKGKDEFSDETIAEE